MRNIFLQDDTSILRQDLQNHIVEANDLEHFLVTIQPEKEYNIVFDIGKLEPFHYTIYPTDSNYSKLNSIDRVPLCYFEPPSLTFVYLYSLPYRNQNVTKLIDIDQDNELIYLMTDTFQIKIAALVDDDAKIIFNKELQEIFDLNFNNISLNGVTSGDIAVVQEKGIVYVTNMFMYFVSINRTNINQIMMESEEGKNPQLYSYETTEISVFQKREKIYKVASFDKFVYVACGIDGIDIYEIEHNKNNYKYIQNFGGSYFGLSNVNITDLDIGGLDYDVINKYYNSFGQKNDAHLEYINQTIIEDEIGDENFYNDIMKKSSKGSLLVAADAINGILLIETSDLQPSSITQTVAGYPFFIPLKNLDKIAKVNEIIFASTKNEHSNSTSSYSFHEIFVYGISYANHSRKSVSKIPTDELYRFNRNISLSSELHSIYVDEKYVYLGGENYQEIIMYGINSTIQPQDLKMVLTSPFNNVFDMVKFTMNYTEKYVLTIDKISVSLLKSIENPLMLKCYFSKEQKMEFETNKSYFYQTDIYSVDCPRKANTSNELISQFNDVCKYSYTYDVIIIEDFVGKLFDDSIVEALVGGVLLGGSVFGVLVIAGCLGLQFYKQKYLKTLEKYQSLEETQNEKNSPKTMGKVQYKKPDEPSSVIELKST